MAGREGVTVFIHHRYKGRVMDSRSVPFYHVLHRPGGQRGHYNTFCDKQGIFFECLIFFDEPGNEQANRYSQANGAVYFR